MRAAKLCKTMQNHAKVCKQCKSMQMNAVCIDLHAKVREGWRVKRDGWLGNGGRRSVAGAKQWKRGVITLTVKYNMPILTKMCRKSVCFCLLLYRSGREMV
jgi:hypothetical protein